MKILQIVLLLSIAASSCVNRKNEIDNRDIEFINENFLTIVDTFAYKYSTLRPLPNQPQSEVRDSVFNVTVYNKLVNPLTWEEEAVASIDKNGDSLRSLEYKKMLSSFKADGDSASFSIDVGKISNHGRYYLVPNEDFNVRKIENGNIIGHLILSRVVFSNANDKAIVIAVIKDNLKSGIVKACLFEREGPGWKMYYSDIIELW